MIHEGACMYSPEMWYRHPVLKRMEDLADNPLVPALLAKIHTDSDETLMKVVVESLCAWTGLTE